MKMFAYLLQIMYNIFSNINYLFYLKYLIFEIILYKYSIIIYFNALICVNVIFY